MAILHDSGQGTFSVISSRRVTEPLCLGSLLGGPVVSLPRHAGPRASCERCPVVLEHRRTGGGVLDERPRPVDPVRRRSVRGGGGPPAAAGSGATRALLVGLRRRRRRRRGAVRVPAALPGRLAVLGVRLRAGEPWPRRCSGSAAIALSGGYEARVLGLGSEEFQRIFRAFVGLTATIGFVSYALKADIARGYIVLALPLALLLSFFGHYGFRKRLHRGRVPRPLHLPGDRGRRRGVGGRPDRAAAPGALLRHAGRRRLPVQRRRRPAGRARRAAARRAGGRRRRGARLRRGHGRGGRRRERRPGPAAPAVLAAGGHRHRPGRGARA